MASTTLSNVNFLSEPFRDTLDGEFTHKLEMFNAVYSNASGYIVPDSGYKQAIPHFNTLSGNSDVITSSLTTTINALTDYKDEGVWLEREKAWGADEMVRVVSGKDVTAEIARQVGQYWAGEVHRIGLLVQDGAFASALASTHVKDDSGNTINAAGVLAAKYKLGDNSDVLSSIVMNSKVYQDAISERIITYDKADPNTLESGSIPMMLGMMPYKTDKLAAVASVYPSYLAAKGSVIYLFRPRPKNQLSNANIFTVTTGNGIVIDIELNRVAGTAGGQDQIITRCSFMVHIPGVAANSNITSNPTDAQLATGANWTKVATDDKLIRIVQYLSK
jgi:hypothetical protein